MRNLLIASLLSLCFIGLNAQKKDLGFEGTITYSVTVEGDVDLTTKSQMPSEVIISYKAPKSSMVMKTAYGNITVIGNSESKEQVVLYDLMGQKIAIKSSKEETEASLKEIPELTVTVTNETKKIAGYTCTKVNLTDGNTTTSAYVTKEIVIPNANWNSQFKNVEGVLMEYSQKAKNDTDAIIVFSAKEVKKAKIKDAVFEIPPDYKQMTMTEFKQMFGGGDE